MIQGKAELEKELWMRGNGFALVLADTSEIEYPIMPSEIQNLLDSFLLITKEHKTCEL